PTRRPARTAPPPPPRQRPPSRRRAPPPSPGRCRGSPTRTSARRWHRPPCRRSPCASASGLPSRCPFPAWAALLRAIPSATMHGASARATSPCSGPYEPRGPGRCLTLSYRQAPGGSAGAGITRLAGLRPGRPARDTACSMAQGGAMGAVSFNNVLLIGLVAVAVPAASALLPGLLVPGAVLEVVAGIIVGPSVLGWVHLDAAVQVLS